MREREREYLLCGREDISACIEECHHLYEKSGNKQQNGKKFASHLRFWFCSNYILLFSFLVVQIKGTSKAVKEGDLSVPFNLWPSLFSKRKERREATASKIQTSQESHQECLDEEGHHRPSFQKESR